VFSKHLADLVILRHFNQYPWQKQRTLHETVKVTPNFSEIAFFAMPRRLLRIRCSRGWRMPRDAIESLCDQRIAGSGWRG